MNISDPCDEVVGATVTADILDDTRYLITTRVRCEVVRHDVWIMDTLREVEHHAGWETEKTEKNVS